MPTQEERLDALEFNVEQFKTETIKAYGEMAMQITLVKGLTEDAVKRLASLSDQMERRFERVDSRFERVGTRLDRMDVHLVSMDGRLGRLENLLMQVLARLPEQP